MAGRRVVTVVDSHQHFWDPSLGSYPWMTEELGAIRRPFGPDDLRPLLAESGVDLTVAVQARADTEETEWLLGLAAENAFIGGVVGWVDLTDGDAHGQIATLRSRHGGTKLVGIRHPVHDEPDREWLLRDDVQSAIGALSAEGLVYDLLVRARELPAAWAVASSLQDVTFVIDHVAKPGIEPSKDWSVWMRELADLPNVNVKLSGLVTEGSWSDWRTSDFVQIVNHALNLFGAKRLMFGSDWPVCLLAAGYVQVTELAGALLAGLDELERRAVFGENALRIYGIVR